jgi:hypothetical protein
LAKFGIAVAAATDRWFESSMADLRVVGQLAARLLWEQELCRFESCLPDLMVVDRWSRKRP